MALACGVYGRRREVRDNWKAVAAGTVSGVGVGLYGTALAARAVQLPKAARYALLPRCITSPLAVAVCTALNTDAAAAVALVVVTGVLGAAFGSCTALAANAVPYNPTPTPETVPAATAFQLSLTSLRLP